MSGLLQWIFPKSNKQLTTNKGAVSKRQPFFTLSGIYQDYMDIPGTGSECTCSSDQAIVP